LQEGLVAGETLTDAMFHTQEPSVQLRKKKCKSTKTNMRKILFLFIFSSGVLFGQNTPCESIGKMVDIGGWQMHYIYFDGATTHKPTVIFESGIRGFDFDWIPIQVELQKRGIASLSYNRAKS